MKERTANRSSRKFTIIIIELILIMNCSLIGMNAYMVSATGSLVNNFEKVSVEVGLDETDTGIDSDDDDRTNSYEITVGEDGWEPIIKDPKVTVPKENVDCWVFVKVEEKNSFSDFLSYEIDEGWTRLPDADGIYYRKCMASDENQIFGVLKDNKVEVNSKVTKDEINALNEDSYPKLNITGYAIQLAGFDTVKDAWAYLENSKDK